MTHEKLPQPLLCTRSDVVAKRKAVLQWSGLQDIPGDTKIEIAYEVLGDALGFGVESGFADAELIAIFAVMKSTFEVACGCSMSAIQDNYDDEVGAGAWKPLEEAYALFKEEVLRRSVSSESGVFTFQNTKGVAAFVSEK